MKKSELRKEYAKPDARLIMFNYNEVLMSSGGDDPIEGSQGIEEESDKDL